METEDKFITKITPRKNGYDNKFSTGITPRTNEFHDEFVTGITPRNNEYHDHAEFVAKITLTKNVPKYNPSIDLLPTRMEDGVPWKTSRIDVLK